MPTIDKDALLAEITKDGEPEVWGADEYAQGRLDQYRMDVAAIKAAPVVKIDPNEPVSPKANDPHHWYCGACGCRLHMKLKPRYCHKCGRKIKWALDWGECPHIPIGGEIDD